jgi:hypothetical protein
MIQGNLVLHRGAREVDVEELDRVPCPPATETWFPVKHSVVLDRVSETLTGAGFGIESMQLSLARDNARFFGTLTLKNRLNDDACLAVGVRNSIDKSFPIGLVCGSRVFVCDNLAFSSEIVIARRHTRFGELRFNEAVSQAVLGLHEYQVSAERRISQLQNWELSPLEADSLLLRSFETGIVSSRMLPAVIAAWRKPDHLEFQPRTGWSLLNAYTGVLKDRQKSSPQEAALQTIQLQRLLNPPDVIDIASTPAIAG